MKTTANTVEEYFDTLDAVRKPAMIKLRDTILENLPKGFREELAYGMVSYVVPHSLYPEGYHCNPKQALPFLSIASQKNFIAVYHMGLYSDKKLFEWFTTEYPKHSKLKLDMGKSCIRFKKHDQIPFVLIAELVSILSPEQWIEMYERAWKKKK